jgi:hypothetical protein
MLESEFSNMAGAKGAGNSVRRRRYAETMYTGKPRCWGPHRCEAAKGADPEAVAMRRTRQAEVFARELFGRFFAENEECLPYFLDDNALTRLWSGTAELKRIWASRSTFVRSRNY